MLIILCLLTYCFLCVLGSCPEAPPTPLPMRKHDVFTKEHTLFILDMMRLHLEREGEGLPKSLTDLNSQLKLGRKNKKDLRADMALTLTEQFKETFYPDKVSRKWCTLVQGYKKVKDNNASTGKGPMHFQFFPDMDDLLGAQHDVVFPVVGTTEGLDVRRQEAVVRSETATASTSAATTSQTTVTATTSHNTATSHTSTPSSPTTSASSNSTPPQTPHTTPRNAAQAA